MRRRHLRHAPNLAYWFGLMPWDVQRLTPDELAAFVAAVPKEK